ncbi:MAG: carotenoid biosynthesis protein [Chloroflexota bacterium]
MTTLTHLHEKLPFKVRSEERIGYVLLGLWIALMIGMPWLQFFFGDEIIPTGIVLAAVLQAGAVFYFVQSQWGFVRTSITFLIVAVMTWGAEFIGHTTNFPFGGYEYTSALQPQLLGVPLLIPVAWFMLLPSSWVMAQLIVGKVETWRDYFVFALVSAVALTAWDLFLDPQMVNWGFWIWDNPSGYFGIPYSNYFGWLLVATLVTGVVMMVVKPPKLRIFPLALVYGIVWFLQTIGQGVIWQQLGPAIVGCVAMGSVMAVAYWRHQARVS